jgi:hypothetical protein
MLHIYQITEKRGYLAMPKLFKTKSAHMSFVQKKNLYAEYKSAVKQGFIPGPAASFNEFVTTPNFDTMVDMKCLACDFSLTVNFSGYAHFMETEEAAFPVDVCPECGRLQFVPLDIYTKLMI